MGPGAAVGAEGVVAPDACRRFLFERGDLSLGLIPQLLLGPERADLWAHFWYAARLVDDAVESGAETADAWRDRLRRLDVASPAEAALARFLDAVPPDVDRDGLRRELDRALAALGRERAWTSPPSLAEYAAVVRDKAGVPLDVLHRLLLPREPEPQLRRFGSLLALSIQVGDDLRDHARDRAAGLQTVTREEYARAAADRPGDVDPFPFTIVPWREAAAHRWAVLALERAERFTVPANRANARLEVLLWLSAIERGQLRESRRPMRWPEPLGSLLSGGVPTDARMAAASRVLHNEPQLWGEPARWDARQRAQEIERLERGLPDLYLAFEREA